MLIKSISLCFLHVYYFAFGNWNCLAKFIARDSFHKNPVLFLPSLHLASLILGQTDGKPWLFKANHRILPNKSHLDVDKPQERLYDEIVKC